MLREVKSGPPVRRAATQRGQFHQFSGSAAHRLQAATIGIRKNTAQSEEHCKTLGPSKRAGPLSAESEPVRTDSAAHDVLKSNELPIVLSFHGCHDRGNEPTSPESCALIQTRTRSRAYTFIRRRVGKSNFSPNGLLCRWCLQNHHWARKQDSKQQTSSWLHRHSVHFNKAQDTRNVLSSKISQTPREALGHRSIAA